MFPTRINGARGLSLLRNSSLGPPPAKVLPSQIARVQRRKEPRFLASAKASGTTRNIYLKGCKVDRPTSARVPGSGSRVFPHPMPTLLRPVRPPTLRSRAWGLSMGLPHALAPPRCDLRRGGRWGWLPLQPPPLRSPPAWRWGRSPYPAHGPPSGGQESPSHSTTKETSLNPERPPGKVGVGLPTQQRRWKAVEAGAGERRGLRISRSREKHPWSMI